MRRATLSLLVVGMAAAQQTSSSAPPDDAIAKQHYQTGTLYYESGRFADAARQFEAAYQLSHRPALQYNIAQCYERIYEIEKAWTAYRAYLRGMPTAPDRAFVEARIVELEKQLETQRKAAGPPPLATTAGDALPGTMPSTHKETSHERPLYKKWWFWGAVGGLVAASVITALVLTSGDDSNVQGQIDAFKGETIDLR